MDREPKPGRSTLEDAMHQGRGGMGMHKHGVSGHPTRSPRFRMMTLLAARKEEKDRKRPRARWYGSFRELFRHERPI